MPEGLVAFLNARYDETEAWARAASVPYKFADDPNEIDLDGGVHWRWAQGDNYEDVAFDPATDEFVGEPGYPTDLVTVEKWQSGSWRHRRAIVPDAVEVDPATAGHIVRHDPASVLLDLEAKRAVLAVHRAVAALHREFGSHAMPDGQDCGCHDSRSCVGCGFDRERGYFVRRLDDCPTLRGLALAYRLHPDYLPEWAPNE